MLEIHTKTNGEASASLTLPFELRQRSRLRATLDDGREVALFLPRGTVLRGGDLLALSDGSVVLVRAADERVSTVRSDEPDALLRAAYHLGNRHVPVQIGLGMLRYEHDHVLDEMVVGLGLSVTVEDAPFEPEGGAYGGHGHSHSHSHSHSHDGGHGHADSHSHSHDGEHGHGQFVVTLPPGVEVEEP
ncbi:MAG: urease accessory protein UreE [Sandaracinus sp.]|nr:urease accessory protein UreE [Sandaracinus sp.]MCB9622350.1 urease accessory protein UreE [Sandaracinus sp.]MCB9636448.1 urease accessory protein UreE [Sandaracinus sp.]